MVRLRAAVVVVVLRCFKLLPPALDRGLANLLGERVPLPTAVELAGAGYYLKMRKTEIPYELIQRFQTN